MQRKSGESRRTRATLLVVLLCCALFLETVATLDCGLRWPRLQSLNAGRSRARSCFQQLLATDSMRPWQCRVTTLCASFNVCGSWSGLVGGAASSSVVPLAGAGSDEVRYRPALLLQCLGTAPTTKKNKKTKTAYI